MKPGFLLPLLFGVLVLLLPLVALKAASPASLTESSSLPVSSSLPDVPESGASGYGADSPFFQSQPESPAQTSSASSEQTAYTPSQIPESSFSYDGAASFRILNQTTGQVETVDAFTYTIGSVCAEMPPTFEPEAWKAQGVASHTYALRQQLEQARNPDPNLQGADFAADPQNWKGYVTKELFLERYGEEKGSLYWGWMETAVKEVADKVLLYQSQPIVAAYHSMSAGRTEDASNVWEGSAPYLVPVESEGDKLAPKYETTQIISPQELSDAFPEIPCTGEPSGWFSGFERSDSGYLLTAYLCGAQLTGKELRTRLDLRSTHMEISFVNGSFLFVCQGYGHGVGLSQYGADYMARQGSTWQEILSHYYQDAVIANIAQ